MGYEDQQDEPVIDGGEPEEWPTSSESESAQIEPAPIFIEPPVTARKLDQLTIEELKQYAAQEGIDLGGAKTGSKIIRIIADAKLAPLEPNSFSLPVPAAPEFDLSGLYEHMPTGFVEALTKALHARGIVEPGDYFKSGAYELFRSAMLSVIKHDFLSAKALAQTVWVEAAERKARGQDGG